MAPTSPRPDQGDPLDPEQPEQIDAPEPPEQSETADLPEPQTDRISPFEDVWRWPEDVERFIQELVPDGRVLNVPAGLSDLGDVRVDAAPDPRARDSTRQGDDAQQKEALPVLDTPLVQGNIFDLPFADGTFDAVVSDPPWQTHFQRHGLFYELVRVVAVGGWIVFNATWKPNSRDVETIAEYRRADEDFNTLSGVFVFRKRPEQSTFGDFEQPTSVRVVESTDDLADEWQGTGDPPVTTTHVDDRGRGYHFTGQLVLDGPDGVVCAHKEYGGPALADVDGAEAAPVELEGHIEYERPGVPDPDRATKAVPDRREFPPVPPLVLTSVDRFERYVDGNLFRADPVNEYETVIGLQ